MKKIARRQSEEAQGGEKNRKNGKSNVKSRKNDDSAGGSRMCVTTKGVDLTGLLGEGDIKEDWVWETEVPQ